MLFTPPTLALDAVRNTAAPAALAHAPELGLFSYGCAEFLGTGTHASLLTDSRTAPGWLSGRGPVAFMAGRTKSLGTGLFALFQTMCRTAPGWLSVRSSQIFDQTQDHALGTAQDFADHTDVRT
ncbi:MAG: hypothetical protein ABI162_12835, partial [Luteolibacter sp.]